MSTYTPIRELADSSAVVDSPVSLDRSYLTALVSVVTVPLVLGLFRLNEPSLWFDEAATWLNVSDGWRWMWIASVSGEDCGGFVYAVVMKLWTSLFGYGEFALRAPSVVFAAAMSATLLQIGRGLGSLRAGVYMALCGTLHPIVICWARQSRAYSLEMFLTAAYLAILLSYGRSGGRRRAAALTLVGSLLALTHIFGIFVVVAGAIFLFALRLDRATNESSKDAGRSLAPTIVAGMLWSLWVFMMQGRVKQNLDAFWLGGSIVEGYREVFSALIPWYGAVVLAVVAAVGWRRLRNPFSGALGLSNEPRLIAAAGLILALVLIGPVAASALSRGAHHFILPRYFLPGIVPVVVAAGLLLASLPRKQSVLGMAILGAAGLFFAADDGVFSDAGEDGSRTRAAAHYLAGNFRKGDRLYLSPEFEASTLRYYGLPTKLIRGVGYYGERNKLRDLLAAEPLASGTRNWVLVYNCNAEDNLGELGLADHPQERFGTIRLVRIDAAATGS